VREARERQLLDNQLRETNEQLQQRVRELTTLFGMGKAVVSITDQRIRLDKIVEGMLYVAEADYSYLLLREENSKTFLLSAHRNLPEAWAKKVGQPFDDGISSLVALSGETLAIDGEPLKRFKVAGLGQSAVVVPIKIQKEVIGLLVVIRKEKLTFDRNMQVLLEAVADYASISLLHARLFRALQETADAAQDGEKRKYELLQSLRQEVLDNLRPVVYPMGLLLAGKMGSISDDQQHALQTAQAAIQRVLQIVSDKQPSLPLNTAKK
jgi:transcriptional regulator with GAF, ATPase, and Fis domain